MKFIFGLVLGCLPFASAQEITAPETPAPAEVPAETTLGEPLIVPPDAGESTVPGATPTDPVAPEPQAPVGETPPVTPEDEGLSLKIGDKTYTDVRNAKAELDGVRFEHADGVEKLKWTEISESMLTDLGISRPESTKPGLKSLGTFFSEASFAGKSGMLLMGLGALCSLYGGLFMLVRAAGVSPFWALVFLIPGCVLAILFYAALLPFLKELGFSSSGFMAIVTSISLLSFFCWLAFASIVGFVAWYTWQDGLPWPLYVLLGAFLPGMFFIFTRSDRGGKPFVWQLAGLAMIAGGVWLNLDTINATLKDFELTAEAVPAEVIVPAENP